MVPVELVDAVLQGAEGAMAKTVRAVREVRGTVVEEAPVVVVAKVGLAALEAPGAMEAGAQTSPSFVRATLLV